MTTMRSLGERASKEQMMFVSRKPLVRLDHRPWPGIAVGLTAVLVFLGCASQKPHAAGQSPGALVPPFINTMTFDAAWRIIHETHYDTNFNGVDWQSARAEFRPKAEAARNRAELRRAINAMLDRLGQSHMGVIPAETANAFDPKAIEQARKSKAPARRAAGDARANESESQSTEDSESDSTDAGSKPMGDASVGLEVRLVKGEVVVFRVEPDGPSERAGVKPGWIIHGVDGHRLADRLLKLGAEIDAQKRQFLAWRMANVLLMGKPGSEVHVEFLDELDERVELVLQRQAQAGQRVKFGLLPAMYAQFHSDWIQIHPGQKIGLIRFNLWMIPIAAPFDSAVEQFRQADGIVIDLRGNLGGIGGMIMGLSGHFLNERVSLGAMKMRTDEIHFNANPRLVSPTGQRVEPFSGPVAILVDAVSLSAAEVFAGGMQSIGRARIFGETTGGQVLPASWDRLPNGDVLYHAIADFVTPTGVRLETRGVVPDVVCRLDRADLVTGRDAVLEAAVDWIARQKNRNDL